MADTMCGRRNGRNRVWLRVEPDGSVHTLEHEADYEPGDTLVKVSTTPQGIGVEMIPVHPEPKDN